MISINLDKIKKGEANIQSLLIRGKLTLLLISAFLAGLFTAIKPIALFSIPVILIFYAIYRGVAMYNEIKNIDLSIDAFNIPITDIINDLENNNQ